jgi:serine/threonine protein kinase
MSDGSTPGPKPDRREPRQLTLLGPPARPPPDPPKEARAPDGGADEAGGEPQRVPALARGDVVAGRYRIDSRIGIGGMASVFLAHHVEIEAAVAIKVLDPELAALRGTADRFLLEAKASSLVHHPNVVAISDFGRLDDGLPYIVMEYLVGEDLEEVMRRTGAMPWSRVRGIALQVCAALQAAHDVGVVHRDVKLQNCFRQTGSGGLDFIKVLDFGIAKVTEDVLADRRALARTTEGIVVGTPDYMAPEQGRRGTVDHRADIYSLGVVLYHLVTGRLPFTATHPVEQMAQHIYEEPPPPSELRPGIDPRVEKLILRALKKSPDDRFASMRDFADAIERVDTGSTAVLAVPSDPPPQRRSGRAWAMLGSAALVAIAAVVWASRGADVNVALERLEVPSEVEPIAAVAAPARVATPVELPVQRAIAPEPESAPEVELIEPERMSAVPAATVVTEPAAPQLEAAGLGSALRRWAHEDDPPPPPRASKRRTRSRAKPRSVEAVPPSPAQEPSELPAPPPVAKPLPARQSTPTKTPDATSGNPFRPVDALKNPYD